MTDTCIWGHHLIHTTKIVWMGTEGGQTETGKCLWPGISRGLGAPTACFPTEIIKYFPLAQTHHNLTPTPDYHIIGTTYSGQITCGCIGVLLPVAMTDGGILAPWSAGVRITMSPLVGYRQWRLSPILARGILHTSPDSIPEMDAYWVQQIRYVWTQTWTVPWYWS